MSKLSLSVKITAAVTVLLLLSLISSAIAIFSMQSSQTISGEVSETLMPVNSETTRLLYQVNSMIISVNNYIAFENPDDFESYTKLVADAGQTFASLHSVIDSSTDGHADEMRNELVTAETRFSEFTSKTEEVKNLIGEINAQQEMYNTTVASSQATILEYSLFLLEDTIETTPSERRRMITILKELAPVGSLNEITVSGISTAIRNRDAGMIDAIIPTMDSIITHVDTARSYAARPICIEYQDKIQSLTHTADDIAKGIVVLLESLNAARNEQQADTAALNASVTNIARIATEDTQTYSTMLSDKLSLANLLIMIGAVVLIISGAFILIFLRSQVIRKLNDFVSTLEGFTSGDGDLTKRIKVSTEDEIGKLGANINIFVENIQQLIRQVKKATDEVTNGNISLATTMEELSATFNSQAEQVTVVATNMNTINDTSEHVVGKLGENIIKMQEANTTIEEGSMKLQNAVGTMDLVKEQSESLSRSIASLVESSNKIGDILNVINDITEQTNLLALNAAIEAARAGEAGRGFSVVADEVRKLAESTQRSTSEISELIASLQKNSKSASDEMCKTVEQLNLSMNEILETNKIFYTVASSSEEVGKSTDEANQVVNEQFEMINTASDNARSIASGIEQSVHVVDEISLTVTAIKSQAESLNTIVAQFKV